jgi:hypothetical protein
MNKAKKKLNNFTPNEDTCKLFVVKIVKTHQIFCCVSRSPTCAPQYSISVQVFLKIYSITDATAMTTLQHDHAGRWL